MATRHRLIDFSSVNLFLWLLFQCSTNIHAQELNLKFDYLSVASGGLSSNRVLAIYRDSKGFLWVGTQAGLNRFDGYSTTIFANDTSNDKSLSHNIVNEIFEDHHKRLWVATQDGLCLFNPLKEEFKVYKFISPDEKNIRTREAHAVCEDLEENVWVSLGKHGGISKWDSLQDTFINYKITNTTDDKAFNTVTDLTADGTNTIWLATLGNGLIAFNPKNQEFNTISDPSIDMGTGTIKRLFSDDHNNIWIMTEGKGLFKFDLKKKTYSKIPVKDDGTGTNGAFIRSMAQFDDTHLFIGVDQGGINSLNVQTGTFEYIKHNELRPRSLGNNGVWSMLKDREGILWVGTSAAGISYYNPKKERFKHYKHSADPNSLSYDAVLCFYEDKEGKIWIGTDGGGLNIFDPVTKSFTVYKHNPKDPSSIGSNVILSIDEDQNDNIWMGTWANGLLRYNRITRKFYQYRTSETNPATIGSDNIWSLRVDYKNNLWISNYDYGIDVYNKNGFNRKFRYDPVEMDPDSFFNINVFRRGRNNKIWIARGRNVSYIDTITHELKDYLKLKATTLSIFSLYEDDEENIWLGTNTKGVLCINKNRKLVLKLDIANGLPNNTVYAILEDDSENLWMATNLGICKYNKTTKTFKNYPQNDPIQTNNYREWTYLKSKSGVLYFGGYNGFNAFPPDQIIDNKYQPHVYISDFQIFGKTVRIGEYNSVLRQSISETKRIVLPHSLSVISFAFTAVSFTQPENIQYKYTLEGFENDWNTRPADRRYVTYTNLDPGEYIFKVKASNNDGVWNENETTLSIVILPPWYQTWWFRILVSVGSLFLVVFIYIQNVIRVRRKNDLLEKLVKQRTREITQRNEEIETQKALLEEKNKLLVEHEYEMEAQNEELQSQAEELQTQSEELQKQTKALALSNEQIQKQHFDLEEAYKELSKYRTQLEDLVDERTKELIAAKEKAEESDKLKSSFLANLSHEIRTPLNAIIGFSSLLLDDDISGEEKESYYTIITNSSDMLLSIINDIIDFSKIEAGQLIMNITGVPLRNISARVYDIFNFESKKQQTEDAGEIVFKVDIPGILYDLMLLTDEIRLMQVIGNLINNAIKYTPHGEVQFGCNTFDNKDWVEFYVRDTGIGIKKEHHNAIFQRFRKIEEDKDRLYRGAGLGLAISSELIQLLHGKINVESELGKGSVFTITVPLSKDKVLLGPPLVTQNKQDYPDFRNINILVVEDDLSNYLFLEKLLKRTGANILHAENGKQAVSMADNQNYLHVILMDIKMPEMDGLQALRMIRQKNISTPIVAQTAHALSNEVIAMKEAGFDFYITKPIKANDLFNCLRTVLQVKEP